jgi:hypothetical protein
MCISGTVSKIEGASACWMELQRERVMGELERLNKSGVDWVSGLLASLEEALTEAAERVENPSPELVAEADKAKRDLAQLQMYAAMCDVTRLLAEGAAGELEADQLELLQGKLAGQLAQLCLEPTPLVLVDAIRPVQ